MQRLRALLLAVSVSCGTVAVLADGVARPSVVLLLVDDMGWMDSSAYGYSDNGGNVHSNTPNDRKTANLKPGNPRYERLQDWRKWAGGRPPTNNAPLRDGKGRIYEGGIRVPLIVRWPGVVERGTTSDVVVGPIDLYPTVLDMLTLPIPKKQTIDGVSFVPVLKQSGRLDRDAYFTWFPHLVPAVCVRRGDWKLIRRFEPRPDYPDGFELFNLRADLGETKNLASEIPARVRELDGLIDEFIRSTGAKVPRPNPAYDSTCGCAFPNRVWSWITSHSRRGDGELNHGAGSSTQSEAMAWTFRRVEHTGVGEFRLR